MLYRHAELEKRQMYEEHVREVEHGSFEFTPLDFSHVLGALDLWQTLYTSIYLANLISEKSN